MILRPLPVKSSQFTWIREERRFVAEISDLGGQFGRVYDDACDEGLTLVSSQDSGRQDVVFAIDREECDAEGDVLYWDLVPASLALRSRVPFTVRVFND